MLKRLKCHSLASMVLTLGMWLFSVATATAQSDAPQAAKRAVEQAVDQVPARSASAGKPVTESAKASLWNQPFTQIVNIDWSTPETPRYVNLGDDFFLFETRQGIKRWDFATRELQPLSFSTQAATQHLERLAYGGLAWARLGASGGPVEARGLGGESAGTVFVASTSNDVQSALLWWSPAKLSVVAALSIPGRTDRISLVQIAGNYALLCDAQAGAVVVRIARNGENVTLEWAADSDPFAKAALADRGIVGSVKGFGQLVHGSDRGLTMPVYYDVSRCGWDMRNAPPNFRIYMDKATQKSQHRMKPYFLADGSVLVPELSYHDGDYPRDIQSALLWKPGATEWMQLPATLGGGNKTHRVGQTEPVFAVGFESSVIEFFDVASMQWVRSVELLKASPYSMYPKVRLEPLSSGDALVIVSDFGYPGMVGVMTPANGGIPRGQLLTSRGIFGEVMLPNNRMLLLGGGNAWKPTGRVELIDLASGQSRALASLPAGAFLPVDPSGVPLPDGSVLVFAGLPAGCSGGYYNFGDGACASRSGLPSARYWPDTGRVESLPQLKIPFSRGAYWQTGNSELVAQWPRKDVLVRPDGKLVWLEGADFPGQSGREALPRSTQLKAWSHLTAESPVRSVNRLRKARNHATLINLADGRLAAVGGDAQLEIVALEKNCLDCPDEFISIGPFKPARSTEILDETDSKAPSWKVGPLANFGGGTAFKLANGRIFKLSMADAFDSAGYRAELANAAFTAWKKLPALPKPALPQTSKNERPSVLVKNVSVIGNRVLILTNQNLAIVWDDDKSAWSVWKDWPAQLETESALSISPSPKAHEAFVRYRQSFQTVAMPK